MELLRLQTLKVNIDDLLLDPNNPRFSKHHDELAAEDDFEKESIQAATFEIMLRDHDVSELENSIREKGFTPVDNIFIKEIGTKYVVVEGNRRITAIKNLLKKHSEVKSKKDKLADEILGTLKEITCVDLSKNTEEEVDFILGLRHHGSIKQWGLLPASFNIYKRYMIEYCKENNCDSSRESFQFKSNLSKKIAQLYSLSPQDVREKLQTYVVYLQLKSLAPDSDLENKFSIIGDSIKNKKTKEEFGFNSESCSFSDDGADKFLDLVIGDYSSGKNPVILSAAAGDSNLRDFAYVLSETTNYEDDVKTRIYENRGNLADIKAELKTKKSERSISHSLELINEELRKISITEKFKELGEGDRELLAKIQLHINTIQTLAQH